MKKSKGTVLASKVVEVEMKKPAFTETMQIGIVVRDLDAAIRRL